MKVSLDESIEPGNEIRVIDLFVESLFVKDFGFRTDYPENGRPAYHPADLLRLFIYGYLIRYDHHGAWKRNAAKHTGEVASLQSSSGNR